MCMSDQYHLYHNFPSGQVDRRPVGNLLLQADESEPSMEQNPSPRKHCKEGINTGVGNKEDGLYTRVEHIIEYKDSGALGANSISSGVCHSKKLELTAENDLQTFNCVATSAATSGVLISKSSENKNKSQVDEMMPLNNKNLPCSFRFHMTRNEGEQKSLSDGDSNVRSSKEETDIHLSCESYHSTELFLTGKKRCKQEVTIGSKKVRKQIQETSYSKSCVKRNSSFMNLISNMMKGCSQSSQDEDKPLALAHENPDCHLWPDQKLLTCNKNQDPELKNSGFKSNFQSMYCQSFENVGTRMSHQVGEASKDFELDKKVHGIDAIPVNCCAENNRFYRQYLLSNKSEVSNGGHDAGPSLQPQVRPLNFLTSHEHWKNNTVENETCYNLGLSKEKEGMALHSPSNRQMKNNNENVESWAMYERKEISHKSDILGDLWITRFSPKSTGSLIFFDHLNERGGAEVHSTYCSVLPHHHHKHISQLNKCKVEETREQSADDQLLSEAKKLQNCCINKEASSTGLKDEKGNNDHTSKHKFNHITPFQGLRDSEPMVSMFARRLGAIKQCQQTE